MDPSNEHIDFCTLVELAQHRPVAGAQESSLAHVSTCAKCAAALRRLENVIHLMTTDTSEDAPRDVLQHALNIFQARARSRQPSLGQRIVAALTFDSRTAEPAFGFRSGVTVSRQLIYSAGEYDVDLRVTPQGDTWIIAGQVLGENCAGGQVTIESGSVTESTELSDLCEFRMRPLSSGDYTLRLRLANLDVEVPRLELRP